MNNYSIIKSEWDKALEHLLQSFDLFATLENEYSIDYEVLNTSNISIISYNKPKPSTPLKSFFLPIKENVSDNSQTKKQVVIIGAPNCDVMGLNILDEIYLNNGFPDLFYKSKRENTIIISTDCNSIQEHCHCYSYGVNPYADGNSDISMTILEDQVFLTVYSQKGEDLIKKLPSSKSFKLADESDLSNVSKKHKEVISLLKKAHKGLPDYIQTGKLIESSGAEIWKKYSSDCVSCGACASICPTCSCFLLIDKPGFEKVKQLDACQYPGFERVAGGEDPLDERYVRFRNRYMCKYVWKPEKFKSSACTGCGRCIESCIGKISKNDLFMELSKS